VKAWNLWVLEIIYVLLCVNLNVEDYVFVANLMLINGCSYWNEINFINLYVLMAKDKSYVEENIFVWVY
jgi:hypothetical protein